MVGGEILNSPLWNLEWTIALWTLNFPARGYIQSEEEEEEQKVSQHEKKGAKKEITILVGLE